MRIVIVDWADAVSHSDGNTRPRHKYAHQRMVGWLLQYDDEGISIAYEYSPEDGSWREEQFIPGNMILKVEELDIEG